MSNETENDVLTRRGFIGVSSAALAAAGILFAEKLAAQDIDDKCRLRL
jgi:homoserine kinase